MTLIEIADGVTVEEIKSKTEAIKSNKKERNCKIRKIKEGKELTRPRITITP